MTFRADGTASFLVRIDTSTDYRQTPYMATTASIRVVKQFTYRGVLRNFSNRYHFDNDAPTTSGRWTTFSDAIVAAERHIYPQLSLGGAKIIGTVGYAGGSEIPVFNKIYTTDGDLTITQGAGVPGDACAVVRLSTADRSSKNHPVYLYSYHHAALYQTTISADTLNTLQNGALVTYHALWISGFSDGTVNHKRCRPKSTSLATGAFVEPLISHRDLPR